MISSADKTASAPFPVADAGHSVDYLRALLVAIGDVMVPAPENPSGAGR